MDFKIIEEREKIKIILNKNNLEVAKATCYFDNTPRLNEEKIGTIGDFECEDEKSGIEILKKCEEILKEKNIKFIVSPMNENTWKKYRVIKYTNGENTFLFENVNEIKYNDILLKSGFSELYTYTSNKGELKNAYNSESLKIAEEKIKQANIVIRKFNKKDYINDLKKIYNISVKSFKKNPLYTEIPEKAFLMQYEEYIDLIDDEFVLIAEKNKKEIGFIFCVPDFNELKQNKKIETIIVKTVAVLNEYEGMAIGNVMIKNILDKAKERGFEKEIFAFMYKNNTSQKIAKRNKAEIIREYVIYGKDISRK